MVDWSLVEEWEGEKEAGGDNMGAAKESQRRNSLRKGRQEKWPT